MRLNLGCGTFLREGYVNIDCRPLSGVDIVGDITDPKLMAQFGDVEHIFVHDVLEHLTRRQAPVALKLWSDLLAPGGTIEIWCPDFRHAVKAQQNDDVCEQLLYGGQDYPENFHRSGYTLAKLTKMLTGLGLEIKVAVNTEVGNLRVDAMKPTVPVTVELPLHGITIKVDPSDLGLSNELMKQKTREGQVPFILAEIVQPGWTCLDIGANLGFYALIEEHSGGIVHAIEPVPRNLRYLNMNAEAKNIKVYAYAVGNRTGLATFYEVGESNWGALADIKAHSIKGRAITVEIVTLDAIVELIGLPDLLRFDIEGGELELVQGAQETLTRMKSGSYILSELHPVSFDDPRDLVPALASIMEHGFIPRLIGPSGDPFPEEAFADFPTWFCEMFSHQAPNVFWEKC